VTLSEEERAVLQDDYSYGETVRLEPLDGMDQGDEAFAIGWDITLVDGEPVVIEYHTDNEFGYRGFSYAGRDGAIDIDDYLDAETGELYTFVDDHTDKDRAHELIDPYMPDLLDEEDLEAMDDDEIVVTKPVDRDGGYYVGLSRVGDLALADLGDHLIVEDVYETDEIEVTQGRVGYTCKKVVGEGERQILGGGGLMMAGFGTALLLDGVLGGGAAVAGMGSGVYMMMNPFLKELNISPTQRAGRAADAALSRFDIEHQDERKGCMRYVMGVSVDEEGLDIEDCGGYWRTASAPADDEDASLDDRYIAHLSSGEPEEATDEEMAAGFRIGVEALATMYEEWMKRNQPCACCGERSCSMRESAEELVAYLDEHDIEDGAPTDTRRGVEGLVDFFDEASDFEPGVKLVDA
jgi:hypothetical protein